jgi:hypothetical protein
MRASARTTSLVLIATPLAIWSVRSFRKTRSVNETSLPLPYSDGSLGFGDA